MENNKDYTKKAEWLSGVWSISALAVKLGISRHTLYKRFVDDSWKQSEKIAIDSFYDNLKSKINGKEEK
jgi:lambda repressor-like predicted transcriptional regulator